MTKNARVSETPATAFLKKHRVPYTEHVFEYVEHGGARAGAEALGFEERAVVKTLIMEDDNATPMIVLMHGDREVSTKNLARFLRVKSVRPCAPQVADRHSGYQVGGTSPFGTRRAMRVYMERTIADLPRVYVNGGRRGYLVGLSPADLVRVLKPTPIDVAIVP